MAIHIARIIVATTDTLGNKASRVRHTHRVVAHGAPLTCGRAQPQSRPLLKVNQRNTVDTVDLIVGAVIGPIEHNRPPSSAASTSTVSCLSSVVVVTTWVRRSEVPGTIGSTGWEAVQSRNCDFSPVHSTTALSGGW